MLSNAAFSGIVPPPTSCLSLFPTAHGVISSRQCCPAISRRLARDAARYRLPRRPRPRPRLYPRMTPRRDHTEGNKNHLLRLQPEAAAGFHEASGNDAAMSASDAGSSAAGPSLATLFALSSLIPHREDSDVAQAGPSTDDNFCGSKAGATFRLAMVSIGSGLRTRTSQRCRNTLPSDA